MTGLCVLGVDPGLNGAFALIGNGKLIDASDIPAIGAPPNRRLDGGHFADLLRSLGGINVAYIEKVSAMPKQGVSSTFKFGYAAGQIIGVIEALKIPVEWVTPTLWKKDLRLSSDKEQSRARALELWPDRADLFRRKMDHGRAEAALIALYGFRHAPVEREAA